MDIILKEFEKNKFNPLIDNPKVLPNDKGVYIVTSIDTAVLPSAMKDLKYMYLSGRPVLYVGITSKSLRSRDYRNHFNGNARGSTLRKSIGSLLELSKDRTDGKQSRYRFLKNEESRLTEWMKHNLFLHFYLTSDPTSIENQLINNLNPPLNLKDNLNPENREFRMKLKELRR
jgi:hypothetical protein